MDALRNGGDIEPYLAGFTPAKDGSMMRTSPKKRGGGSPTKSFQGTGMSTEIRQVRHQAPTQEMEPAAMSFEEEPASSQQ